MPRLPLKLPRSLRDPRRQLLAVVVLMLVVLILTGTKAADYPSYIDQWTSVAHGDVPWRLEGREPVWNAYGPLYLAFVPLFLVHPLLPKVLFGLTWVAGFLALVRWSGWEDKRTRTWLLGGYLLGPLFWVDVVMGGHFDIIVALLVVATAVALEKRRDGLAAGCFAAGILLKFVPLAMAMVLFRVDGRWRWRFALTTAALVALGFLVPYLVWGEAVFYPLLVSAHRGPKLFSIFRYLEGDYSVLRLWSVPPPEASRLSMPLMAVSVLAASLFAWMKRLHPLHGATLVALALMTFYKVGHLQFYTMPVVLLLAWLARTRFRPLADPRLHRAAKAYVWWMMGLSLVYAWTGSFNYNPWQPVREVIGVPCLAMNLWLAVALIRHALLVVHPASRRTQCHG